MDNIIINFTSDPSGLQPGIDGLVQMEVVDRELGEQVKKTTAEIAKRDKTIKDGTAQSTSQIEKLSVAFKNLDKGIVGGTYAQSLKELQKNISGTADEYKALGLAIDFAKKRQKDFKPDSAEWKELELHIRAAEEVLKAFGAETDKTEKKQQTFKARLREIKTELQQLEDQGKENTAQFQELSVEAAKLEDQIGDTNARIRALASDTANFDAAIQGVQTLASGYQIAQGAAALFGEENEDVQKALVKLNAIMAITNGLREVQLALQSQSILRLKLESIGQQILATSTRITAGAYNVLGISVNTTSTSFKVLRTAILTTGIGAIVVLVGFLAEKMLTLADNTDEAAEKQNKLNEEYDEFREKVGVLDELDRIQANRRKGGLDDLKRELEVLRASNASKQAIFLKEQQVRNAELQDINRRRALLDLDVQSYLAIGSSQEKLNELKKEGLLLDNERLDKQNEITAAAVEFSKQQSEDAKKKSKEAADKAKEQRLAQFNDFKAGLEVQLLAAQEGSQQQLDLRKRVSLAELQIALENEKLTINEKKLLIQKYFADVKELSRQHNQQLSQDEINTNIATLNSQLSLLRVEGVEDTNAKVLELKKELIDRQAELEVISIEESEKNEELRRAKIQGVYDKALEDKKELERAKLQAEINEGRDTTGAILQREKDKAQIILENEKSTAAQRKKAQEDLFNIEQARIDNVRLANEQEYENKLISYAEYLRNKLQLDTQQDELDVAREQQKQDRITQIKELALNTAANLTNFVFSLSQRNFQAEEERIQELHDQKQISDKEYDNQLRQLRKKQSEDEKAQAIFTTLVNQGPMIIKGFQQGGFAGVAAAFTLFFTLLSAVTGAKVPAYKEGEVKIDGPGTTTSDSIVARISKGESVISAAQTNKHEKALRAINEDRYIPYLLQYELPKLYSNMSMPHVPEYVQNITNQSQAEIDYEKLGDVVAQKLAENPHYTLSFDENGFHLSVRKGNELTEFVNKKLST